MKTCDICGRDESALSDGVQGATLKINLDDGGLWICAECGVKIRPGAADANESGELDEALKPLVGQNAGAICRTLELPYEPPYQAVIDAASKIGYDEDRCMSTWSFLTQWLDGTTVWLSEDKTAKALVYPSRDVQINEI